MIWKFYWRDLFGTEWSGDTAGECLGDRETVETLIDSYLRRDTGDHTMYKAVAEDGTTIFGHIGEFGKSRSIFQTTDADISADKVLQDWKDARMKRPHQPTAPFAGLGGSYTESAEDRHGDPETERYL